MNKSESKHIIAGIKRVTARMDTLVANQKIIQDSVLQGRHVGYDEYRRLVPPIHPVYSLYARVYEQLCTLLDIIDPDYYIFF